MSVELTNWLFQTEAVRVSPEDKPFWYTSGKIGPFYINTHYLYGSPAKAEALLEIINTCLAGDKRILTQTVLNEVQANYETDEIYHKLCDSLVKHIKFNLDIMAYDYISGGERRDWFFSIMAAKLLNKPHITLFKDLSGVMGFGGEMEPVKDLNGAKVLHIADLITEASSYERAWVPALRKLNGVIDSTVAIVDRKQNGKETLRKLGVKMYPMTAIDGVLFDMALELGLISTEQYDLIIEYINDPDGTMKKFLKNHPDFLANALASDEKTRKRAELCIEKGFY
ncbi:MAG: orotate phosphoribosyltransferase [Clostridiales bacterium]|jgi:orotate phosphoribosyltransferase|nr:orotate phosphoribosyltransferase [Clostridiales bacterium]